MKDMNYYMKIALVTLLIWQHENDENVVSDFKTNLENDEWMSGKILYTEEKDMDKEYDDDDHILNKSSTTAIQAEKYFDGLVNMKDHLDTTIGSMEKEVERLKKQREEL